MRILQIGKTQAYALIQRLNAELEAKYLARTRPARLLRQAFGGNGMTKLKAGDSLVINVQIGEVCLMYKKRVDKPLNINEFVISVLLHELADRIVAGKVELRWSNEDDI